MGKNRKVRVGITTGDVNGIGLEVILKTLTDARVYEHCTPIIYASEKGVLDYMKACGVEGLSFKTVKDADKADPNKVNVVEIWGETPELQLGQSTPEAGQLAFNSLKAAVEDIASNKLEVIVTAPINKKNIQSKEFDFPGHTEFLANYANEENPLMILAHQDLRVALVTGHIAVADVANRLSSDLIAKKLEVFAKSLNQDFGIHRPRIAVLGLNPHNGDNGLMGEEESQIIQPAIRKANDDGILAFGPYPADGFFGSNARKKFDGILAMYHDQGLAPFKALAFNEGINFTAGLPIVRTSPDHGVGYDIAGKDKADPTSFRQAIFAACDIYHQRKESRELLANSLEANQVNED